MVICLKRCIFTPNSFNNYPLMKNKILLGSVLTIAFTLPIQAQHQEPINDINTPLHLLQPDYRTPYGIPNPKQVKSTLDKVFHFIAQATPMEVIDSESEQEITDFKKLNKNAALGRGMFRLTSYEWGVTYSALQRAAEITGDKSYQNYVIDRFNFLASTAPYFRQLMDKYGIVDPQMKQVLTPHALDDAGAVSAAMLKALSKDKSLSCKSLIDNYMDFILHKEYRLSDGTYGRNRPQPNSVWLDDMFMAIPSLVNMGKYTNDPTYYDEAARQISLFSEKMWVPEMNLFRHGWVESMQEHPAFFWGRANGWAVLTMSEVLDALPENHPERSEIMKLYKSHIKGLCALQDGDGFWHQLLNRPDSYQETSATAIYTYCLAHGVNQGWLDAKVYGPVAQLGWNAVTTKITDKGEVIGTCVGTGMGFDPAFYYHRPTHVCAAHGYGPVIWAGAEIIQMLKDQHPKMNDSAVMYYEKEQKTGEPIFFAE